MTILSVREGLEYTLLGANDPATVADVVAQSFTDGSEPTALALSLGPEDLKQFVDTLLPKFLEEGLSIVARDGDTGELKGVQLNLELSLEMPIDPNQFAWAAPLLALAGALYEEYFQGQAPAPGESVHLFMIGVPKSSRGKGIAQHLLDLSLERARERGYRRAVVEASGVISQHLLHKAGFTTRIEIPYATFEYEGRLPFSNTGAHPSVQLMDRDL